MSETAPLVHIGLMKTGTTTLQNRWRQNPRVALSYAGALPAVQAARILGKGGHLAEEAQVTVQPDVPGEAGRPLVVSQEALSTAYINERESSQRIDDFQRFAAAVMAQLVPRARILIVVREPVGWIKSIYNQSVKQGGFDTFPEYLVNERDFLLQSLDIARLVELWGHFYGAENVLILPMELMRDDERRFHATVAELTGLPACDTAAPLTANPSISAGHLKVMRAYNQWEAIFSKLGNHAGKPLPAQLARALSVVRFFVRGNLENPTPELDRLLQPMEQTLPDLQIDPAAIDEGFVGHIKSRWASCIQGDFFGYRTLYC